MENLILRLYGLARLSPALDLPFDCFPDKIKSRLPVRQCGIDLRQHLGGQGQCNALFVLSFASHLAG